MKGFTILMEVGPAGPASPVHEKKYDNILFSVNTSLDIFINFIMQVSL